MSRGDSLKKVQGSWSKRNKPTPVEPAAAVVQPMKKERRHDIEDVSRVLASQPTPVVLNCGCKGEMHDANCACTCTDISKDPWCPIHSLSVQPAPVVVPEIEPAVKLLADVLHLWIDGYITKSSNSAAPLSISSDVFDSIERFLIANRITVDYCGWSAQPAPLPSDDDDNFTAAARFAGITFSQGCQFHLMMQHLSGKGPAPGFLKTEPAALPSDQPSAKDWEDAVAAMREAILNERFQLAESGIESDQVNAVLGIIDDHTTSAALPVGQKETFEEWWDKYRHTSKYSVSGWKDVMRDAWNAAKGGTN